MVTTSPLRGKTPIYKWKGYLQDSTVWAARKGDFVNILIWIRVRDTKAGCLTWKTLDWGVKGWALSKSLCYVFYHRRQLLHPQSLTLSRTGYLQPVIETWQNAGGNLWLTSVPFVRNRLTPYHLLQQNFGEAIEVTCPLKLPVWPNHTA